MNVQIGTAHHRMTQIEGDALLPCKVYYSLPAQRACVIMFRSCICVRSNARLRRASVLYLNEVGAKHWRGPRDVELVRYGAERGGVMIEYDA